MGAVARLALGCLATAWLTACGHVETFSLSLDPAGTKLPPRGYLAFCQSHQEICAAGKEQTMVFTQQRWAQLVAVNELYNTTILPETDDARLGILEHWDFPDTAGDCEDYVLAKKAHLAAMGFPKNALLIAVVDIPDAPVLERRHAVLLVTTDLGNFVLDNRHPDIRRWDRTEYTWIAVESTSTPDVWQGVRRTLASR